MESPEAVSSVIGCKVFGISDSKVQAYLPSLLIISSSRGLDFKW
ncbi:unnamed protein product [Brassica napus]|uniref:(rape) hypothetical protein n=1 Tax=Brassica napus TaxID=3708 RepID=A0A816TAX8_BRANA|nr:unnamed protein product [Brassica napus]